MIVFTEMGSPPPEAELIQSHNLDYNFKMASYFYSYCIGNIRMRIYFNFALQMATQGSWCGSKRRNYPEKRICSLCAFPKRLHSLHSCPIWSPGFHPQPFTVLKTQKIKLLTFLWEPSVFIYFYLYLVI